MAERDSDITGDLLEAIYDAAMDASKWDAFLDRLAQSIPGTQSLLVLHDPLVRIGRIIPSTNWDPSHVGAYNEHFGRINPWLRNVGSRPVGLVTPSELMCPVDELLRTEFYSDWLVPQKIRGGAGVTIFQEVGRVMAISTLFTGRSHERKSEAMARMQLLVPHLQRAAKINQQLAQTEFRWQAAEQALNRLLVGVVIVDEDLSALFSNLSADALIAKADGIGLTRSGRLALADTEAAELLARMVRQPQSGGLGILSIRRPSRERRFSMLVAPLPAVDRAEGRVRPVEFKQARAILFIKDAAEIANVPGEVLSEMFDLSRAEARVVTTLLDGYRLEDAAAQLGVSHNTVKTQLPSVFAKLGCARQSDLIRLIASSLPHFIR